MENDLCRRRYEKTDVSYAGMIHLVVPSFFTSDRERIGDIKISTQDGSVIEEGVRVVLSRPKNMAVMVDDNDRCSLEQGGREHR